MVVVHSPKAGVNFFSLGDFENHMRASLRRTRPVLVEALSRSSYSSSSLGNVNGSSLGAGSSLSNGAVTGSALNGTRSDQRSPDRKRFVSTA